MTNKLRVAVIGCGLVHHAHGQAIMENAGAELAAVCDIDGEKAALSAETYNAVAYTDYREMLDREDLDIVHITTPHYLHGQMSIDCMKKGLHVICEKPAAIHTEDALRMKTVSLETGRSIGICFQNRFNTTSRKMKEIIDSGKFGKVTGTNARVVWSKDGEYYKSGKWRGKWATEGGGVLINQAIHTLDLQLWIVGMPVKLKGTAFTSVLEDCIEVEDTSVAVMGYDDPDIRGNFYATNAAADYSPVCLEIYCENGRLTLCEDLVVTDKNGNTESYSDIDISTGDKAYWGTGHKYYIDDFYECTRSQKKPTVGIDAGINTLKVIHGIYRSAKSGRFENI